MARRALALTLVLVVAASAGSGCALGDDGPASGQPLPMVTHPSHGPDGGPSGPGASHARPAVPACEEADDVTASLGVGAPGLAHTADGWPATALPAETSAVQIVPSCAELEVPVPFTVPEGHERLGAV